MLWIGPLKLGMPEVAHGCAHGRSILGCALSPGAAGSAHGRAFAAARAAPKGAGVAGPACAGRRPTGPGRSGRDALSRVPASPRWPALAVEPATCRSAVADRGRPPHGRVDGVNR